MPIAPSNRKGLGRCRAAGELPPSPSPAPPGEHALSAGGLSQLQMQLFQSARLHSLQTLSAMAVDGSRCVTASMPSAEACSAIAGCFQRFWSLCIRISSPILICWGYWPSPNNCTAYCRFSDIKSSTIRAHNQFQHCVNTVQYACIKTNEH